MQARRLSPLVIEVTTDCDTALGCYAKLNTDKDKCFLFESVQGGERWARYSFIGLPCREYFCVRGKQLFRYCDEQLVEQKELVDPLAEVENIRQSFVIDWQAPLSNGSSNSASSRFCGGLVGYFAYECVGYVEPRLACLQTLPDSINVPEIWLLVCDRLVVYDNLRNCAQIICHYLSDDVDAYHEAKQHAERIAKLLTQPQTTTLSAISATVSLATEHTESFIEPSELDSNYYQNVVKRCKEYIAAGDVFQVVPSQRVSVAYAGDPLTLYRALRVVSPSPYMYFIRMGELSIVGASPETMVRLEDGLLTVRPIAGTATRSGDDAQDEKRSEALLADQKERAEHNMLVDLARNDLGRIAKIGSVQVTSYMQVEYFSHVMHLVSTVTASAAQGVTPIDALRAAMPAGTLSGAPKIRAMEIIHELEPVKRGVYSGAIGYMDWRGNMDTAIPIRTFVLKNGMVHMQAGGGIVADSDPLHEWYETLGKRRALFRALSLAKHVTSKG